VIRDLLTTVDGDPESGRHPDSETWERAYGCVVPGETATAQLNHVGALSVRARRDAGLVQSVLFGVARPSVLETAVGVARTDPSWTPELETALSPIDVFECWPMAFLDVSESGTG
jgi:hypothetical protein